MASTRLIALAGIVVLAGCAGFGGNATTATPATQTGTPTPSPTASPVPTPSPSPTPSPTATPTPGPTPTATPSPTPTPDESAVGVGDLGLTLEIDNTSECGFTCRKVNYTVADTAGDGAENVSAAITISSGGVLVWNGTQWLGTVAPGESVSQTLRVEVGLSGGVTVLDNDGQITIFATITADDGSATLVRERRLDV